MGDILTPSKAVSVSPDDFKQGLVMIPKIFQPRKTYFEAKYNVDISFKGYYLLPHTDVDIYFLLLILNSPFSNSFLMIENFTKRRNINIKILDEYPMPIVGLASQKACGLLEMMIEKLYRIIDEEQATDRYMGYRLQVLEELRLALAVEMLAHHIIVGYDLNLLDEWQAMIDSFSINGQGELSQKIILAISDNLFQPTNEVMNSIKKFRLIAGGYVLRK